MIRELTIENFRAFRELHLTGLGRVNLLVGANNSGKTSVLEAIAFLALNGGLVDALAVPVQTQLGAKHVLIPTGGLHERILAGYYENIVLTPEEGLVIAALREIEGRIARLVMRQIGGQNERGFAVALEGSAEPVPLGSLGDGIHRMLAIALSLVAARGGYLLIDEIDTGLHHTVMQKMWRLVFETAKRLDVTVFATTHSYDCVHALASIARPDIHDGGEVSLIRIERDNPKGIHFTEAEISHLAEWQIEAR